MTAGLLATFAIPYVQAADNTSGDTELQEVVVTGTMLKRTDTETPSPVTVLSAETLQQRGINTIAEALQRLPGNNAGTIQQGWNAGWNFAAGANAPALRGLTVQDTLSVADGLRLPQYPYGDDGHRGFVDLNQIPDAIIDHIEVLGDGASSTYGTDAIAGVVNVITKKEIKGLKVDASGGLSQKGGGNEQRFSATYGFGDLASQGYNVYFSGEYQNQNALWARDRGFPFNTQDWSSICNGTSCLPNLNWNGVTAEDGSYYGLISIPGVSLVRPVTTAGGTSGSGRYQFLNASAGCRQWKPVTIDPAASSSSPLNSCEVNWINAYGLIQPHTQRIGATMHFTGNVGDSAQVYAMATYYKVQTYGSITPYSMYGTPAPPNVAPSYNLIQPVYVCPTGVGTPNGVGTGCDASNGTLNPYNPFASLGETAQINLRNPYPRTDVPTARTLRVAAGIDGTFGDGWGYRGDFTAAQVALDEEQANYPIPQRIMDVVARGEFNFNDPTATPQSVWDFIAPTNHKHSTSNLWLAQATVTKDIMPLPGGMMRGAVGVSYRQEGVNAPSGNPQNDYDPYTRYFSINAVGAVGSRNVKSGSFEVDAPVMTQLDLTASGRYDKYSSGQSNFSPKLGFKFKPIDMLAVRGTFSKGFRVPSFNEAFGLPTTGYVTTLIDCNNAAYTAFCAAHGNNAYATSSYSLGETNVGNPALNPEKSTSFTGGLIFQPFKEFSGTIDYWNIKVKGLIRGVAASPDIIEQYYTSNGQANIPGYTLIPDIPDQANPTALPRLGFIQASFQNQNWEKASGIDFGANLNMPIMDMITWHSTFNASLLSKLELNTGSGIESYAGTLSPCDVTSCSGAPKWRATWQNSFEYGKAMVSLTTYWTQGYDTASVDYGGVKGDCANNIGVSTFYYEDGTPFACTTPDIWNVDMTGRYKLNDKVTIYGEILNVLNIGAKFDPAAAYGLFGFNPAWSGPNIMGRYFRIGVKLDL